MSKKALTEQGIAAIAEGAAAAQAAAALTTPEAALAAAALAAASPTIPDGDGVSAVEAAAAAAAAAAATPAETKADVLSFLQTQIAEKDRALLEANMAVKTLEATITEQAFAHTALVEIAAKSVNNMRVALNLPELKASEMTVTALLAEHKSASSQFITSFKAGSVAAVDAAAEEKGPVLHPLHSARIAATRSKSVK